MRLASALALVLGAGEGAAHAYCQQTTHDDDTCQPDPGRPIAWPRHCLAYSLHEAGSEDVPFEEMRAAVRRSMDTWEDATRSGETAPCTDFTFSETDVATCTRVAYEKECGNVNLVVWRENGWVTDHGHDRAAIALSTIFFAASRADIVSTDMELNGEFFSFAAVDDYAGCDAWDGGCPADIQNTVTHEAGHLFGLAHVAIPEATMDFAEIPGDTNKRSLDADDVEAICDLYPAEAGGSCNATPPGGLDVACVACDTGCCTTTPGVPRPSSTGLLVAIAAVAIGVVRRRR